MMQSKDKIRWMAMYSSVVSATLVLSVSEASCLKAPPLAPLSSYTFSADGKTTYVVTPTSLYPPSNPYTNPPGSNHLPTVYENICNSLGVEIPNTLSSTPSRPYNLHPDPEVSVIDKTSPTDDLTEALRRIHASIHHTDRRIVGPDDVGAIQLAIDILEGNPVPGRTYSGFPLLHFNGPNKIKKVQPICAGEQPCLRDPVTNLLLPGQVVIGGNVNVRQIWFDGNIESDTAQVDPSEVLNVPWTTTYTVDTLNRGRDDFAPSVFYFDEPVAPGVVLDQTFFPMNDGTRTIYKISMAPGKYFNLNYHWGWRVHSPRVQVIENARKRVDGKTLPEWEQSVFGMNPLGSPEAKLAAINMIGDLAPAKRMWSGLRKLLAGEGDRKKVIQEVTRAFHQWKDRNNLPDGVTQDPNSDLTLFYANNTIYGHMTDMVKGATNQPTFPKWQTRGTRVKVSLINGDYFDHAYTNVDFGGLRGWENTFQSTVPLGGSGPWFTFGRDFWNLSAGAAFALDPSKPPGQNRISGIIKVGTATRPPIGTEVLTPRHQLAPGVVLGKHNVEILYNFEPNRRLRFYQFDPFHHDVAVWSVH